jgi:hypothetical protein
MFRTLFGARQADHPFFCFFNCLHLLFFVYFLCFHVVKSSAIETHRNLGDPL